MSRARNRGWERDEFEDQGDDWQALAAFVCPIPRGAAGAGDPGRAFHHDLPFLADMDLALEKQRALFRSCLERDVPDLWWLRKRVERIEDEQTRRRADLGVGPTGPTPRGAAASAPAHPPPPPAPEPALDRDLERLQYEDYLRWQETGS